MFNIYKKSKKMTRKRVRIQKKKMESKMWG
jgi:hypothetical protein